MPLEMDPKLTEKIVEAYHRLGTVAGAARAANCNRETARKHLVAEGVYDDKPLYAGRVGAMEVRKMPLPKKGEIKRYLLTSAQNNTRVAPKVWDTVLTIAEHYDAQIMVGTFTYNKAKYGRKSTKRGHGPAPTDLEGLWYDPEIEEYVVDEPVQLAPGFQWRGELNILPTAVRPLSDLESYTGRQSAAFPHVKVAMESVASGKHEATKFNYTTGTVTKRNYIWRKAGQKADFHHCYGCLLLEVDSDGDWFPRHIGVDSKGVAYDLDVRFTHEGEVTFDNRVANVVWGDIHRDSLTRAIEELCWGEGGMFYALRPHKQFMHDLLDFLARNPHVIKKALHHDRFATWAAGYDCVEDELGRVAGFLEDHSPKWCETVIVCSNHDLFFKEWLRIGDYRHDPINAIYFLRAQLHMYESLRKDPKKFVNMLRWAVEQINGERANVRFLDEDESFVQLGIEHGMHGHLGLNGARGTPRGYAKMGRRVSHGDKHTAGIVDGVYTAGLTGDHDQGYNRGPGSWSRSHIVTYQNGKRAIVTMWNGKWRACTS